MSRRRHHAAAADRLRHPADRPVPPSDHRRQHRHRAAPAGLAQAAHPDERVDELLELIGLDPARVAQPLPGAALGRRAPARRRGAGDGRRAAGHAHGRAIRRGRSDRARAPAERVPAPAPHAGHDGAVRHPRHRRGDQDGHARGGDAAGRPPGAVRAADRAAAASGQRLRGAVRRRRPRPQAAGAAHASPTCTLEPAPVARVGEAGRRGAGARRRREAQYVLLLDADERPLGWIKPASSRRTSRSRPTTSMPRRRWSRSRPTLRDALSMLLASAVQTAVVVDERGRYQGVLTLEALGHGVPRGRPSAAPAAGERRA